MIGEPSITRALFCQEIVEAIFSHLSLNSVISSGAHRDYLREYLDEVEQRKKRRTLASAARVSKYISDVALSVLWARLDTFHRLFRVLPQYSPRWDAYEDCLEGEPTEADWARLEKYAALVREVHFFYVRSNEKKVWEIVLDRYRTAGHFLPRLAALATLHVTPADSLFDLPLLLPTLRHLSIQLDTSRPRTPSDGGALMTTALERIATAIPFLSSLKISFASQEPTRVSWKMASFQSLRRLDVAMGLAVDTSIYATIGQFHDLRALSIYISGDCSHLQGCLQALIELSIGGRASHTQSFLAATSPPLLQSLSLAFVGDPNTELLAQCMSTMTASVPATLSALTLESDLAFNPPVTSVLDIIQPALAFRALTHFRFKFRPLPSVGDDDILAMLTAWPTLTTLRIERDYAYHRPDPPPDRPTALIFPSIALRCPHLDTLELPEVDLGATPALAALSLPPLGPRGHPLRALDMACEPDFEFNGADRHACMRAAVMLDRLFPRMELPGMRGDAHDEGGEKGWAAVVRLLHAMQAGRAHADGFERAGWRRDGGGGGTDGRERSGEHGDEDEDGDEDMGLE